MQRLTPTDDAVTGPDADDLIGQVLDASIVTRTIEGIETIVEDGQGEVVLHFIPGAIDGSVGQQVVEQVMSDSRPQAEHHTHFSDGQDSFSSGYTIDKKTGVQPTLVQQYADIAKAMEDVGIESELDNVFEMSRASVFAHPDSRFEDSNYTGIEVNNNWASPASRRHESPEGLVVGYATFRMAGYEGGELVLPELGYSINMRQGDVVFMSADLVHGFTPTTVESGTDTSEGTNPGRVTVSPRIEVDESFEQEFSERT